MPQQQEKYQLIKTIKCRDDDRNDVLLKILRDENTGEKFCEIIENPEMVYYINKDEYRVDPKAQVSRIEIDKVRPVKTTSSNIVKSVAYQLGKEDYFWDCIKSKKFSAAKEVFMDANVHGSDVDVEDYYIGLHYADYPISESKNILTKSFFDIEVDSIDIVGFPEADKAECPINAISFFNDSNMTLYEFLLRNDENPQIEEFETKKLKGFKKRIKQKYKDEFDIDIKVKVVFYDEELELIGDFFNLIHALKPDFCMAWNLTKFDMQYILTRLAVLGEDPNEYVCDPELEYMYSNLYIDNRNQDPADKSSSFQVTDYTNWQDQLLLYANLRKQFGKKDSYKLDDIAYEEIGANKVHFKNPKTTMKTSCYDDYEEFVEYSMHDSVLLYLIEKKNEDCNMIYAVAAKTETRILKALKKTICIKNLARRFYYDLGYIMSNNHNIDYTGTREKSKKEIPWRLRGRSEPK